jgi:Mg/Co/Ni transporter MgtE
MNKIIRTYFYMIVGAISGLIGWQASNLIGLSLTDNVYLNEIPVGAMIGLVFGILLGALEGLLTRNWVKILKGLLPGAILGGSSSPPEPVCLAGHWAGASSA